MQIYEVQHARSEKTGDDILKIKLGILIQNTVLKLIKSDHDFAVISSRNIQLSYWFDIPSRGFVGTH